MSKISPGTILLAFLAVLCGLIGVFFAMRPKQAAVPVKAESPVTVPVASSELTAGRRITLGDIALLKLTRSQMKAQGITGSFMGNAQQTSGDAIYGARHVGLKSGVPIDKRRVPDVPRRVIRRRRERD